MAVLAADITTDRTSAGVGGAPGCDLVCGGTDWEPYGDTVFVLPKTNGGVVINVGVRCVVMFCRVCGNARFHSTKVLERADV